MEQPTSTLKYRIIKCKPKINIKNSLRNWEKYKKIIEIHNLVSLKLMQIICNQFKTYTKKSHEIRTKPRNNFKN